MEAGAQLLKKGGGSSNTGRNQSRGVLEKGQLNPFSHRAFAQLQVGKRLLVPGWSLRRGTGEDSHLLVSCHP